MNTQNKPYSLFASATRFAILSSLLLTLSVANVRAQAEPFIEGGHYELLDEVQPVQTGDKIEVVEMFWYRCPHCFQLEPFMVKWLKNIPENTQFVRTPAVLNRQWEFHAKAYYMFEALGVVDELHDKFYSAIHVGRLDIDSADELADWAAENGVNRQSVIDAFNSFAVESKFNFAKVMTRKYGLSGVPAVIVDGRYRTTVGHAGSQEEMIKVINFLIEKAVRIRATLKEE